MTGPNQNQVNSTDGLLGQILLEQGRQGTQLAVISEQLKAVSDHESRLRSLEASVLGFKSKVFGAAAAVSVAVSAGGTWIGLAITHH
jgi:hypothetical protein